MRLFLLQPRFLSAWSMNWCGTTPNAMNIVPNTYTEASMDSPQLVGVPLGRRLPYGIDNNARPVARRNEKRKASLSPGFFPIQSNAISNSAVLPRELLHEH